MSLFHESRITLKLAFPLMIGQLSQMLLGVADTVMVGQLGVTELAALTFANSMMYVPFVFGIGLLSAVSRQRANRALHALQRDGLLRVEHGGVEVLDLAGLRSYSGDDASVALRREEDLPEDLVSPPSRRWP